MYTSLGYQLDLLEQYEEALPILERSIELRESGYVEPGSLASSYGELSQALAALGRFEEALHYDVLAVNEVERLAEAGDARSQKERWIYLVNRARLYLQLQRIDEAETLLHEAIPNIADTRRKFRVIAKKSSEEIQSWREHAPFAYYQRDWRWIERLREAISFNAFAWLAHAGPFSPGEQTQWQALAIQLDSEEKEKQKEAIVSQSKQREVTQAIAEEREPALWYPAIPPKEVQRRIELLQQLAADILCEESNKSIHALYHDKITEEICFLQLIEAAHVQDRERFQVLNQQLYPALTQEEMHYCFDRVQELVGRGLQHKDTQDAANHVISLLQKQLHLTFDLQHYPAIQNELTSLAPDSQEARQYISQIAAQRFFSAVLVDGGCEGWKVIGDVNAADARVEAAARLLILPDRNVTLEECKTWLAHEVLSHIADTVAGDHSPLGLLAVGTKNYMPVSEGLALHHELQAAKEAGKAFDDSKVWLGPFAIGLAAGVCAPPLSFFELYTFLKAFLILFRLLRRPDEDREAVPKSAHSLALTLCLRTFRGVPDLQEPGVYYGKDSCYLRGMLLIQRKIDRKSVV